MAIYYVYIIEDRGSLGENVEPSEIEEAAMGSSLIQQIVVIGQVVQEGHSVLIFCSSLKGCESTARHVAKYLKRFSFNHLSDQNESIDINSAIDALRRSPAGLDPVLEETLPAGVAYHHAGTMSHL